MKTNDIMNLDYRKKENQEIIQKVLKQIKPLSKYSGECDIPFSAIEKVMTVLCKKYCLRIKELIPDIWSSNDGILWRIILINETNEKVIDTVYGISMYEVFAKGAIRLYAEVKKGVKTRK